MGQWERRNGAMDLEMGVSFSGSRVNLMMSLLDFASLNKLNSGILENIYTYIL